MGALYLTVVYKRHPYVLYETQSCVKNQARKNILRSDEDNVIKKWGENETFLTKA